MSVGTLMRSKSWVVQVTALCIVLGVLIALALKTQQQAEKEGTSKITSPAMNAAFRVLKEDNTKISKELTSYKEKYESLAKQQAEGVSGSAGLEKALNDAKVFAGTVAVRGPGLVVTLIDSPLRDPKETRPEIIEGYMIHDRTIRSIANELFIAGAKAVSVNGQRLVATSAIRCVGPAIMVNSTQIGSPFIVTAIGKADDLSESLKISGTVVIDSLDILKMISVKSYSDVVVPAYNGSTQFRFAHPVGNKQKNYKY